MILTEFCLCVPVYVCVGVGHVCVHIQRTEVDTVVFLTMSLPYFHVYVCVWHRGMCMCVCMCSSAFRVLHIVLVGVVML